MDFKQLQSFVTVVQYKSFTKAAEALFISQPTISTHIYQLEDELNTKLILRTTKSIEITPKGQELYEYAQNILELKKRMIEACSVESKRIIHLGASTIPSAYILPQLLPEFGKQHPDIYFIIHQNDSQGVIDGLHSGLFNIGFVGMKCDDEALNCYPFCKDHMIIITPITERYLEYKARAQAPIEELLREPLILREKGSGSKKIADRFLESHNISEEDLHIIARVNDQEAIKNLVAGGLGISIISEKAAQNFLLEKRVLGFQLPPQLSERDMYVIYRKDYSQPTYVREFIKFVTSQNK